ncbi:MAG TPA: chromate transporter [Candidatus Saccharimonadales bacterium]|jgi:chromate transporter|nr:chromate transporter [Candidatus Saccharimonadales bacterium]
MIAYLAQLFVACIVMSLTTFGGGAQALFYQFGVQQTHWITRVDLSAMLAFGYATPGPAVFGTAPFIGYKIAGLLGIVVGAIGIFLMPFLLSVVAARYGAHLLKNPHAELVIKGVGLAAAGLVLATSFSVLHVRAAPLWQLAIVIGACVASLKWKLNPLLILLTGGIVGLVFAL